MVSALYMESRVVRQDNNGGVDCLVVNIALGGRFFAAQLSINVETEREDCIGKHFCLLVAKSWPIFFYHCRL